MELQLNGKAMRKIQAPHAPGAGWENGSSDGVYHSTFVSEGDAIFLNVLNGEFKTSRPDSQEELRNISWVSGGTWSGWLGVYGQQYALWSRTGSEVVRAGSAKLDPPTAHLTCSTVAGKDHSLILGTSLGNLVSVPDASAQPALTTGPVSSSSSTETSGKDRGSPIHTICASPSTSTKSPWVATGDGRGRVAIWDLPLKPGSIPRAVHNGLRMIHSSSSAAVVSKKVHPGTCVVPVRVDPETAISPVTSMATVANGAFVAVGYSTGQLLVFDTENGHLWAEVTAHARAITALASPDGGSPMLASTGDDGVVHLWSIPSAPDSSITHRGSTTISDSLPVGLSWVGVEDACTDSPPSVVVFCYDRSTVFVLPTSCYKA